jgi:integrase/recombinase XerD
MTLLAPHVTAFFREQLPRDRQASNHTCDAYAYTFRLLFKFMATAFKRSPSSMALDAFDAPLVLEFLRHIEEIRGCAPSTRNARLAAIRSFARYLELREPSAANACRKILAIPVKRTDKRLVAYLTNAEVETVLQQPDVSTRMGRRDRAMIHLCYAAGLRVTELVTLRLDSLTLGRTAMVHVLGKGRRERQLPVWRAAASDLKAWLNVRGNQTATALFIGASGEPLSRSGFEYILEKYVKLGAKVYPSLSKKTVSPHVLRHTCAMSILAATGDVRKVSLWLGHSDVKTTEMYLHADVDEKLAIVGAVVPPSLRRGRFTVPDSLIASLTARS